MHAIRPETQAGIKRDCDGDWQDGRKGEKNGIERGRRDLPCVDPGNDSTTPDDIAQINRL
jgi:hypothetical protein